MSRVATMSLSTIVAAAGNIARCVWVSWTWNISVFCESFFCYLKLSFFCRTLDRSVFKPIVQISVIGRSESSDCHLLAVTHAGKDVQNDEGQLEGTFYIMCGCKYSVSVGVRLYFSTSPFAPPQQRHIAVRPSLLALVHVRLPPGFSASSTLQKPANVHKALHSKGEMVCYTLVNQDKTSRVKVFVFSKYYGQMLLIHISLSFLCANVAGVLLMAASETEDNDRLWCINHDSFPFKKPLMETQVGP